jgi:hypothetical protein
MQQIYRDWMAEDTVSTNCGCPSRTLESPLFKSALGFIFLVPCFEKELLLSEFLCTTFLILWSTYDPTAFTATKLVLVAWSIAYGAVTEPRATCGSRPHGLCRSARAGIEVVDQALLLSYIVVPLLLQISSLVKMSCCSNGKSTTG